MKTQNQSSSDVFFIYLKLNNFGIDYENIQTKEKKKTKLKRYFLIEFFFIPRAYKEPTQYRLSYNKYFKKIYWP